jgi:hypothetical protein
MTRHPKLRGILTCQCGAIAIDLSMVEGNTDAEKIDEIVNALKLMRGMEKGGEPI